MELRVRITEQAIERAACTLKITQEQLKTELILRAAEITNEPEEGQDLLKWLPNTDRLIMYRDNLHLLSYTEDELEAAVIVEVTP